MEATDGDTVQVTYEGAYRGREHTVEGEVISDPYQHRDTPDDALDLRVTTDDDSYVARVKSDGRFSGLHHATRRHDHRKGSVVSVEVIRDDATEVLV